MGDSISGEKPVRLMSIDAFRGFDMFWIAGGGSVIAIFASLFPGGADSFVVRQLQHVAWEGVHFEDLIFPVFLFIAGLSFPFSYAKQLARGESALERHLKVLKRACLLIFLGMVFNGFLRCDWHHLATFRYGSVLGKIGVAWFFAALVYMHFKLRGRIVLCVLGLVGYAVMLSCVAPDAPAGASPTSLEGCFVGWLDRHFTPGHLYCSNLLEPSGPFVSFFGFPTALIGMFAGDMLRRTCGHAGRVPLPECGGAGRASLPAGRVSLLLAGGGVVCLALGYGFSPLMPIIKILWTPTFTFVACGWGLLAFALFHYVIDVRGWSGWTYFFRVIGANAIVAYMIGGIIDLHHASKYFLGGLASLFPTCADLIIATGHFALLWLLLDFLYRRKIFLRV